MQHPKIEIEAANRQIPAALVELNSRYASSTNVDVNDAPLVAFDNLIEHQPDYDNDIARLISTVQSQFNYTFAAWERRLAELKEYKATVFDTNKANKRNAFSVQYHASIIA